MGATSVGHESTDAAARGVMGRRATSFNNRCLSLRGGARSGPEQLLFLFLGVGRGTEAKAIGGAAMGATRTTGQRGKRRGMWVQGSGARGLRGGGKVADGAGAAAVGVGAGGREGDGSLIPQRSTLFQFNITQLLLFKGSTGYNMM